MPNLGFKAFYYFFLQRLVCLFLKVKGFMCLIGHVLIKNEYKEIEINILKVELLRYLRGTSRVMPWMI